MCEIWRSLIPRIKFEPFRLGSTKAVLPGALPPAINFHACGVKLLSDL
jgi:hypothetical protein